MKSQEKRSFRRILTLMMLTLLGLLLLATKSQASGVTAGLNAAAEIAEITQAAAPAVPEPESETHIRMHEFDFDPLAIDLRTTQGATASTINEENLGLFLVQFNGSPNDAMRKAVDSLNVTYVQYIPDNAYIVWTNPGALRQAGALPTTRWAGSFYSELRSSQAVRQAAAAPEPTLIALEALFVDDGSLARLEALILANDGTINYRQPTSVMDPSLPAERWNFSIGSGALSELSRWPGLVYLEEYSPPVVDDSISSSVQATGTTDNYRSWLAETGYDGLGVRVAINDTGIDWDHPDFLESRMTGQEMGGYEEAGEPGSDGGFKDDKSNAPGHGTHVAGIVAGYGASPEPDRITPYGLGVAPGVSLHAVDYVAGDVSLQPLEDVTAEAIRNGASIANNSYGGGRGYNGTSQTVDKVILDVYAANGIRDPFIHVFTAGNDGNGGPPYESPRLCVPAGSKPCLKSLSTRAESKNAIVVGSSNSPHFNGGVGENGNPGIVADWVKQISTVSDFSSRGPAADGRIKPDVLGVGAPIISTENRFVEATGRIDMACSNSTGLSDLHSWCSGTSMAAPSVAGVVALFNQYWRERVGERLANPEPATVKAALIATASRLANLDDPNSGFDGHGNPLTKWPNEHEGWGRVNADQLLNPSQPILYYENPKIFTNPGETWSINVRPADPTEKMRIVLVWSDAPGAVGNPKALVNDLDLYVTRPGTAEDYCGNDFETNKYLYNWDCSDNGTKVDKLNNVEVVLPEKSQHYNIQVKASEIKMDAVPHFGDDSDQNFSLVCVNCVEAYYVDDSVNDGLIAYWKFDEQESNASVQNSVSAQFELSLNEPEVKFSKSGAPTHFKNYGSLLYGGLWTPSVAHNPAFDSKQELSIAMWVNPTGRPASGSSHHLLSKQGDYDLYLDSNGKVHFTITGKSNVSGGTVPLNSWNHIAATWHKNGYLRVYVNGSLVAQTEADSSYRNPVAASPIEIGKSFQGYLDEVRFYNQMLKKSEVQRLAGGWECETSGAHWSDAFRFASCGFDLGWLQNAEVRIAEGTYTPGTNRAASFLLAGKMVVKGGYEGRDGDRRDWQAYPTILSGDLDRNDNPGVSGLTGRNSYHVVHVTNLGTPGLLDGFIVEHGQATELANLNIYGGGIYDESTLPHTLRNLVIRDNLANQGGGLYAKGKGKLSLTNAKFVGNKAVTAGGGAYLKEKEAHLVNTIASGNRAKIAAGIYLDVGSLFSMYNATIYGNEADSYGGLWVDNASQVDINSSILYANKASDHPQLFISLSTNVQVRNSIVEGGYAGSGNMILDPLFADPDGEDNTLGTIDDNLQLTSKSPAIDQVDSSLCAGPDFSGTLRNFDGNYNGSGSCDLGAYEYGTILVVSDSFTSSGEPGSLIDALQEKSLPYEIRKGKPSAARLSGHPRVLWATGDAFSLTPGVGPSGASETAVKAWLDSGNRCMLFSSKNYFTANGGQPTAFIKDYFGVGGAIVNRGYRSIMGELSFPGQKYGLKARSPEYRLTDNDVLSLDATSGSEFAFKTNEGEGAGILLRNANSRTMFLGFALEQVSASPDEAALDRGRILDTFFENCETGVLPFVAGSLSLNVIADPQTFSSVGDKISYTYTISNTDINPIDGPFIINDDVAGVTNPCGSGPLAAGAATSCQATYETTQADLNAGVIGSIATASNTDGGVVSTPVGTTVTTDGSQLALEMSADRATFRDEGEKITYTYTISNISDNSLNGPFAIGDTVAGTTKSCGSSPLAPGGQTSCQATYTVIQADLLAGLINNLATATVSGATSNKAIETVLLEPRVLSLDKSADRETFSKAGEQIIYTYVIKNNGREELAGPFSIADDKLGTISPCGSGPLAPGAETSCQATHTVTQANIGAGSISNVATASGNGETSAPDSVTVTGPESTSYSINIPVIIRK